jgi:hypothetical protein
MALALQRGNNPVIELTITFIAVANEYANLALFSSGDPI